MPFFEEGCPSQRLTLQLHQQVQARLSTGAGGLDRSFPEAKRRSASIGNRAGVLLVIFADLSGVLGDVVMSGLAGSDLTRRFRGSLQEVRVTWGVAKDAMANRLSPQSRCY